MKKNLLLLSVLFLSGCTTIKVNCLGKERSAMKKVCIQRNPKVIITDFISVLENEFAQRKIATMVYDGPQPAECIYRVTYTANRSWDIAPYMVYAEIRISKDDQVVGFAEYRHSGGLALNKWASTSDKLEPVFKKLFSTVK